MFCLYYDALIYQEEMNKKAGKHSYKDGVVGRIATFSAIYEFEVGMLLYFT